jgi:hypothetical protein
MILLEAITQTGGISADWVLVILVTVLIMLFGFIGALVIKKLDSLAGVQKEFSQELRVHENKLIEHRAEIDHNRELIEESRAQHGNSLQQILERLQLVKYK